MENFGIRTVLILAAAFLIANLGWLVVVSEIAHTPTVYCTYHGVSVVCAPEGESKAVNSMI